MSATYEKNDAAPVRMVGLSDIYRDPAFQIRHQTNAYAVDRYANAYALGEELPPVTLARWNGGLVLVDGWHRVTAAGLARRPQIAAKIVEVASLEELKWLAAEANLTHGEKLLTNTYREVFRRYIRADRHRVKKGRSYRLKSYEEIAKDLHGIRKRSTIQRWMWEDFRKIAEQMSSNIPAAMKGTRAASDPEESIFGNAKAALDTMTSAARALTSEERRGELIVALREALADLETLPHVLPPPPAF